MMLLGCVEIQKKTCNSESSPCNTERIIFYTIASLKKIKGPLLPGYFRIMMSFIKGSSLNALFLHLVFDNVTLLQVESDTIYHTCHSRTCLLYLSKENSKRRALSSTYN